MRSNRREIRTTIRTLALPILYITILTGLLMWGLGCDRQDNDWAAFDPDAKLVVIQVDPLTIAEGAEAQSFQVSLGMVPDDTVTVLVSSEGGQVQIDPDTLIIAPIDDDWATVRMVNVLALNDAVDEGPHSDALTLMAVSSDEDYNGQGGVAIVPVLITDNDGAGVAISETFLTLVESPEGGTIESYNVVLLSQPTDTVTVISTIVPAEPSLHVDPDTLYFAPDQWNVPQRVTMWAELDDLDFDNMDLSIQHSAASVDTNYGPELLIPTLDLSLIDDTLPPVARIAWAEGGSDTWQESLPDQALDFVVNLDRPSSEQVIVHLATLGGTAVGGDDFTILDEDLLFEPGGPTTRTVSVMGLDDSILEWTENFEVAITAVQNVLIGDDDRLTIQVQDNDTVELTLSTLDVNEDAGSAEFIVSIPHTVLLPLEFTFVTSEGTALAGNDYEPVAEIFVIEPGQVQRIISVVLLADADHELDETFTVHLENLSGHATWSQAPVSFTILNDDPQTIVFEGGEYSEMAGNAVFTVSLESPYGEPISLMLNTLPGDGLGGVLGPEDAVAEFDYVELIGASGIIPAGATTTEFTVAIVNDTGSEAERQYFRMEIAAADQDGFAGLIATSSIVDDDLPCLMVGDLIVDETDSEATFRVDLNTEAGALTTSSADVTFQVETMDQTAIAGDDYVGLLETVTIPAGQSGIDVPVTLLNDLHDDDNEMFVLVLTDPVNATGNCRGDDAFCRIQDDEFPSLNLFLAAADQYNEGSDFEFVVRLTTPRQEDTVFDLNLSAGTSNGQGVDYTFADNGPQTILAFQTELTFAATFLDDQLAGEVDETIQISIGNANVALGAYTLEGIIIDAPELSVTGAATSEGTPADFLVTLDEVSTAPVQFMVQFTSGTATAGSDFPTSGNGPFSIAAGDFTTTFSVPATAGDGGDASTEDFIVTLINGTNATMGVGNSAVGTIDDMDPPELYWAGTASAVEGSDIPMQVNLSWSSEVSVQFEVSFTSGTAIGSGIDFDSTNTGPYSVPPRAMSFIVPVPTIPDGNPELAGEDFTITLHSPVEAVIGAPDTGTGTVLDGDQPELTIPVGDVAIEGSDMFFTVHLSEPSIVPVSFRLDYADGTTQGVTDYDDTNRGMFSIAPGAVEVTVTVHTFDDAINENQEAFIVMIGANPVNAVAGNPSQANGVINDDDP